MRRNQRGFSLVELLVVVGIVTILVALLLPALNKARQLAQTAACLSNIRQMGMGLMQYTQDNKGKVFRYDTSAYSGLRSRFWIRLLRPYTDDAIRLCPAAIEPYQASNQQEGTAFNCWGPKNSVLDQIYTGSYCFNGWWYGGNNPVGDGTGFGPNTNYWSISNASQSSDIPVFADGIWVDAFPDNITNTPPANTWTGAMSPSKMNRMCIQRHGRAVNVVFWDTHAETVPLQQLWTLQWFYGNPRASVLPTVP